MEIGPGKTLTKEDLDKKYAQRNEQSRDLQAAGWTGVRLTTMLAAESFVPKFERSKTRKRERDEERRKDTWTLE
jgi:hypothetical protein